MADTTKSNRKGRPPKKPVTQAEPTEEALEPDYTEDPVLDAILEHFTAQGVFPDGEVISYQEGPVFVSVSTDLGLSYSVSKA